MTVALPPIQIQRRVVLDDVSWGLYQSLLEEVGDRPVRLTFDQGRLEIMTLSPLHEKVKTLIARLIETYADAVGIDVEGFGSTTFNREELQRGLEPDECYYVQHAAHAAPKTELDLTVDPPPDLAIEIDISPADVARQPIYAALGVPEVWRYDGSRLTPLHRRGAGGYSVAAKSLAFPNLPMDQLNRFLATGLASGQSAAIRALRQWLRTAKRPSRRKK